MAKKVARKTARSKKTTRRPAAKPAKKTSRRTIPTKASTKSEIFATIAEDVEISRKEVAAVFESLSEQIGRHLHKRGPGTFSVPGLMKLVVQRKPATKARKGINPFTGEETMFKAKPARNVVKVRPLKNLKDMVN